MTAALTASSAALLLTACGSGGVETRPVAPESASASASAAAGDRPEAKLPGDMKLVFEDQRTGDATKDTILADNERTVSTVWRAMAYGDMKKSGMALYYTDNALVGVYQYAKRAIDKKTSWAGTLRYYDRQVTLFDKESAALTYCVDESKADLKNRETNELQGTKTTPNSYVFYNLGLKKNAEGVWQTWDLSEDRGSQKCRP
ncbi:hypothetical protein G3M58_59140 [Streptomyces sp. SID7499]|uniref:Uncharacterized protein n=1 Tax=Streptomyces sp. SID7499 TaxID=2706086 RepID=A0A6G3XEY1_9ACTN|nr:hypothetical protein [Streptomyces sp. SID7499]